MTAIASLDTEAVRPRVHARVQELFGDSFTPEDLAPRLRRGVPGEPAWQNNLDSLYDRLKKSGILVTTRRGEPWALSSQGRQEAASYLEATGPTHEKDLLDNFRPKDSSDYLARLEGRELVKHRSHEKLIFGFGKYAASHGWTPRTDVHPRDLVLQKATVECLVEARIVYDGNVTDAVRAALAQLLMYQHFLYERQKPRLIALFDQPIGSAYTSFLARHDVSSVWRGGADWAEGSTASILRSAP